MYSFERQSEQRFRALVDASAQIVWTTAGNGDVVDRLTVVASVHRPDLRAMA